MFIAPPPLPSADYKVSHVDQQPIASNRLTNGSPGAARRARAAFWFSRFSEFSPTPPLPPEKKKKYHIAQGINTHKGGWRRVLPIRYK